MKTLTAKEVQEKLEQGEQLNIIDVREDDEVREGMIPGAKHVRLGTVEERVSEFDKDKEYVMVCRSGGRSGKAYQYLESQGFNVINMEGGMLAWEGETK
ncbi:molybdopterin biosynthesis MoeB protein [Pontibacillus halophilus JSM 076056 = DSM 19796]|uniref:Molybdopterin biosynthesis MoeB protein n=1 Tax=Pontibacillus halophilus JSM 076056 = DSM 19796 TaxID=1385510 RepID=A0A0A5I705_9BACI|nr:rhodanese-like domain-containing protein [Pontibacillus halophilus]KGX91617.1 molybdopterin biosynthesis MoeB protein [Pontibacillus halophilus JSM 076056 = DSM 19796]